MYLPQPLNEAVYYTTSYPTIHNDGGDCDEGLHTSMSRTQPWTILNLAFVANLATHSMCHQAQ